MKTLYINALRKAAYCGWLVAGLTATFLTTSPALAQRATPADAQPRVIDFFPKEDTPLPDGVPFALQLAEPMRNMSQAKALCDVWGLRSAVPVEIVTGSRRENALKAFGIQELSESASKPWVLVRCLTNFPDGAFVSVRWLNPKPPENAGERDYWDGQRFNFRAASDWPLSISCTRANAAAGCSPLNPVRIQLNDVVSAEDWPKVRFKGKDGKTYAPHTKPQDGADRLSAQREISFVGLPAEETLSLEFPAQMRTEKGIDLLAKARGKPARSVRMGPYPPLVKFASGFGIVERQVGLAPITVRSVESSVGLSTATTAAARNVKLRSLRVRDEATIIEVMGTLRRLTRADDSGAFRNEYQEDPEADGMEPDESQANRSTRRGTATVAKLKFPFAAFEQATSNSQNRNAQVNTETRGTSWLRSFQGVVTQDLPRSLEASAFEVVGIPLKEPGLHVLEAESLQLGRDLLDQNRPMYVRSAALVTDLAVHLHYSDRTAGIWVTSLANGRPIAGSDVSIYDCRAKRLGTGKTDAKGFAQVDHRANSDRWNCPLYAFAKLGDDLGFVRSDWQQGIESWRFGSNAWDPDSDNAEAGYAYGGAPRLVTHAVLPRNLLRAGETFFAKVFVRGFDNKGQLAAPRRANMPQRAALVHEGSGDKVETTVVWDARGNGALSWRIPAGAKRGEYALLIGDHRTPFRIEDFRLPSLKAEVLAPAEVQVAGSSVNVGMRLSYLSGGPAAGETVRVAQRLASLVPRFKDQGDFWYSSQSRWSDGNPEEAEALESSVPQRIGSQPSQGKTQDSELKLDAQGSANVSAKIGTTIAGPRTLVTDVEYRDPNGETYRAVGRTPVWPASVILGYKASWWNDSGTPNTRKVEFKLLNTRGQPVANAPVNASAAFRGWVSYRAKSVGGFYSYQSGEVRNTPKPICSGRTNAQGIFVCQFSPAMKTDEGRDVTSGELGIQGVSKDAQGRTSTVALSMYVYGGSDIWFEQSDHDRMDVIADKKVYAPGEVAQLQVRSPFREATALITVARTGGVVDTLTIPISGSNPTIRLPLKPQYAPNVHVNVLAVRGRVAEPAATALVDLAKPAFKLGLVQLTVQHPHHALQVKLSTDKTSYQSRETAKVNVEVTPHPTMPFKGDQEVALFAVDEALLELLPNATWDTLKTMLAKRTYGFETASAAMQVIGRRHYGRKAMPAGGGGGRSSARELFDTLLIWRATVKLDANGRATADVKVNDSLTRFRVVAVASAGLEQWGTGESSFVATKDLQLRSSLPATVREGDAYSASFVIRNGTAAPMTATARAAYTIGSTETQLTGQSVTLQPNESRTVTWGVSVPMNVSTMSWRIDATDTNGRADALAVQQEVQTPLSAVSFGIGQGSVKGDSKGDGQPMVFSQAAPTGSLNGRGEVLVSVSPAFAVDASGVRKYMAQYPFFCLEQRTSKALSLKSTELWDRIAGTIDQYLTPSGLVNYYPGEGWYGGSQGYPHLTAFVLAASHEAGFKLPANAEARMLRGLSDYITGKIAQRLSYVPERDGYALTEEKLSAIDALLRYQSAPASVLESLRLDAKADLPKLSHHGLMDYAALLHRTGSAAWPNAELRRAEVLLELANRTVQVAEGALALKNRADTQAWYYMHSEPSAAVKLAMLTLDVPALAEMREGSARGAMRLQQGRGHWWDTQANVWGALMLDKRQAQATTAVQGKTTIAVHTQTWTIDWSDTPKGASRVFSVRNLGSVAPPVAVIHQGSGQPFAAAYGTAYADLQADKFSNANLTKTIRPLRQQTPGQWRVGDIMEVKLRFHSTAPSGWFVVNDAIPPGAVVLGGGLKGQDMEPTPDAKKGRWDAATKTYEAYPAYVERSFGHVRAYYEELWGDSTFTYQLRLNTPGQFKLPASEFQAMYDATINAYAPQPVLTVRP